MPSLHTREQIWARDVQGLKHAITVVRARIPGSPELPGPPRFTWGAGRSLNLIDEQYVGLDEVGTHMWQVFSGAASVGEAYRLLLDEYEVEPARLENDITAFLDGLLRRNLIEYIDT